MRKTLIAGNWKMNTNRADAVALAKGVADGAAEVDSVDLVVCPPAVYLSAVGEAIAGSPVALGAQNMSCQDSGAFTGEISHGMLTDLGSEYVILGHSERRTLFGEQDKHVCDKTHKALAAGLVPIVCVGETLEERESGKTAEVIKTQFEGSLDRVDEKQITSIVIAYEPVWAIGTGKVATPEQAEEVHADLRRLLAERYTPEIAEQIRILYGGSMKPGNAPELLAKPNVDGGLIGGAALKAEDFLGIAKAG